MFLCWEKRQQDFVGVLPYISRFFRHLSCRLPPAPGADKQPVILTFCSSLVGYLSMAHWYGLASLAWPHLFIALSAHFRWPHLRWPHWLIRSLALIGSLAHWLIGVSLAHWLICAIFGIFRAFLLQLQDLRASGLFNLKLLVLELRFWLVKRSLFPGTFQPFNKASRASATLSDFDLLSSQLLV